MKNFLKFDFYLQTILALVFLVVLILDLAILKEGFSFIAYFVIAASHTLSFSVKNFSPSYIQDIEFKVYSRISILILILLLTVFCLDTVDSLDWMVEVILPFLAMGILLSPLLAIWYIHIVYRDYKKLKTI